MSTREKLFFINTANARLAAALHEADAEKIVIFAHGFTGSKHETGRLFVTTARSLAAAGITALRFDFMGSGDSSGEFFDMSPETEIRDLLDVIAWARRRKFRRIGVLGISFGGAASICATARSRDVAALATWSSVPSFKTWRAEPVEKFTKNPLEVGGKFYTDRPAVDVPEAYCTLEIPKLQIQGDADLPGFLEEFSTYFPLAKNPKKHMVIPGADHTFNDWRHRKKAIAETVKWFRQNL